MKQLAVCIPTTEDTETISGHEAMVDALAGLLKRLEDLKSEAEAVKSEVRAVAAPYLAEVVARASKQRDKRHVVLAGEQTSGLKVTHSSQCRSFAHDSGELNALRAICGGEYDSLFEESADIKLRSGMAEALLLTLQKHDVDARRFFTIKRTIKPVNAFIGCAPAEAVGIVKYADKVGLA